jgi:hypothetical protein
LKPNAPKRAQNNEKIIVLVYIPGLGSPFPKKREKIRGEDIF